MDQKDYHFYDMDDKQTENIGLMEHQDEQPSAPSPNTFCGLIAGVLALLLLAVSLVLAWILFSRHTGSSINLSHAIMCTLGFLFAALAAFFAFALWKGSSSAISGNPNLAFLIYIGSILFAVYFIVAALYLWVHQQFFSHLIKCSNSVTADWESNFWGMDYTNSQLLFWRIYLILVIFAILIAVCFAVLANAAWNHMTNKVQAKRITLGVALIAIVVWGFLVLIWFENYKATYHYIQSKLPAKFAYAPFIVFIFGIVALGVAFLNSVFNFIKVKTLNFIFAFIWIGFFLVFAIFVALLFKNTYSLSKQSAFGRQEVANFIPENQYGEFCGSKYLDVNQNCGSSYSSFAWDRSPAASVNLNPTCDCSSTDLILWPWYVLAILSAFLLGSVAVAAISNFALGSAEKDDEAYASFHIFDIVALALIVCLAIALGFWLGFRPAGVNNAFQQQGSSLVTSFNGNLLPSSSFAVVPQDISQNIQLKDQCYFLGKASLPIFAASNSTNAGYSIGVLVTNGKIISNYIGLKAQIGPKISRQFFFPNADNSRDDFVNIYGTTESVNNALRNLVVCQTDLHLNHGVYLGANKIDVAKIANNGLSGGVAPVYTEPYPTGSNGDLSGFVSPVGACGASCKYALVKPLVGYLNIRGSLLIKNANGQTVNYGVPEANLELNVYQNQNGKEVFIAFGSYDANGNFLIQAPYIQNAGYKAVLHIDDNSGQYLSSKIDISVSPPNANSDLQVGNVYLTTVAGQGCKETDLVATQNCFASLTAKNATFNLQISDVINLGEDLEYPLILTVRKSFSELGAVVATQTLDGPTWSRVLPVGYYNLQISGNNYNENIQTVTLDNNQTVTAYLERKVSSGYRIYAAIDNTLDPNSDYDLNLKIRAADGTECTVSPINKICPYATHVQSISQNQKGFEVIDVPQFTNAYYMVYVTKNSARVGNCPYTNTTAQRFLTLKDNHLVEVQANSAVRVFTTNLGGSSFGKTGASSASSYSAATSPVFNPIKYGDRAVVPNVFVALSAQNNIIPADKLFNSLVRSSNDASLFAASMPILYPQNKIQEHVNLITGQKNFPSTLVSSFKSNINTGTGNQANAQSYVTSEVFNLIATQNSNQNQIIRDHNNLPASVNFYDVNGDAMIPNYMHPYGAIDTNVLAQVQANNANNQNAVSQGPNQTVVEVTQAPVEEETILNSPQNKATAVNAEPENVVQVNQVSQTTVIVPTDNREPSVSQNNETIVVVPNQSSVQSSSSTNSTIVIVPSLNGEEPNNLANQTIVIVPISPDEESGNFANDTIVIVPSLNADEPNNAANQTIVIVPINPNEEVNNETANNTPNLIVIPSTESNQTQVIPGEVINENQEGPVNNRTQVETEETAPTDENANVVVDSSNQSANVSAVVQPTHTPILQIVSPDLKIVEASSIDYSNIQSVNPSIYYKTIQLNADGTYPLNTDLIGNSQNINDLIVTQSQVTVEPAVEVSQNATLVATIPEETVAPVEEAPIEPAQEQPVEPVQEQPEVVSTPAEEKPAPVKEEPTQATVVVQTAPVQPEPAVNAKEVSEPVQEEPEAVEEEPETVEEQPEPIQEQPEPVQETPVVNVQVVSEPVKEAPVVVQQTPVVEVQQTTAAVVEAPVVVQEKPVVVVEEAPVAPVQATVEEKQSVAVQANSVPEETPAENEDEVVPDRRLSRGRLLQAMPVTYQTQFCFTGFGERSIKPVNLAGNGDPSIQACASLYPDSDSYSLLNLKEATQN